MSLQQHTRIVETYTRVHDLRFKGADRADIARMVGVSRKTVYRYLAMTTPPERKQRQMEPTALAAFIPFLTMRWNEGCHNGMRLWREIKQQGYPHSAAPVLRFIHAHLRASQPSGYPPVVSRRAPRAPTAGQVARCWIRDVTAWTTEERTYQAALLAVHPTMEIAYNLTVAFVTMVRHRTGPTQFEPWLAQALACPISALRAFARSLDTDHAAVMAGLTVQWSNGQLEGQINRLKLLKCQSYGRAGFELLQRRVMLSISCSREAHQPTIAPTCMPTTDAPGGTRMVKKVLGVVPLLLIHLVLLAIFMAIALETLRTCPEHVLSGYSLLIGLNIGLFTLTGYLMVSRIKHTQWNIQFGRLLVGVTVLHIYLIFGMLDSVSSCPINQELLNVDWSVVML